MEESQTKLFPVWIVFIVASAFLYSPISSALDFAKKTSHPVLYQNYASKTFVYNPRTLRWKAMKNGKVVRSGRGSGGANYCKDVKRACRTPTGTYRIISKRGRHCKSSRYPLGRGGAPMPYCLFFSKYYAIHGSPNVPKYNASHGCIRVQPSAARWLHGFLNIGSKVIVKSY